MLDQVTRLLDQQAAAHGDKTALVFEGQELTFSELREQSLRLATALADLGVRIEDRVAFWLPNCPEYLILYHACARLGAIAVAVNTRYRAVEVADIVSRSGAKLLIFWPGFRGIDFTSILQDVGEEALAGIEAFITCGDGETDFQLPSRPGDQRLLKYQNLLLCEPIGEDRSGALTGCNIFTTSGTTKAPKFVLHHQSSIAVHAQQVAQQSERLCGDGAILQVLPLCGVFGFTTAMFALAGGRPLVILSAFDARECVELIDRHQVRYFNATDDMVLALLAADPREKALPTLACCGYASFNSDPLEVAQLAAARDLKLVGLYGMSEVQALFSRGDESESLEDRYRGGGYLLSPDAHVRAVDPESGRILEHGEQGELQLTGPSLMREYFQNPQATAEAMTEDGYLRSGDMGYTVSDRKFVFLARMGDALRLGGFLTSPLEIESHISERAEIAACQVVAVTVENQARAVAFVIPAEGAAIDSAALKAHCEAGLAKYKCPVAFLPLTAFPTTKSANGTKIQRAKLRQMAEEHLGQKG